MGAKENIPWSRKTVANALKLLRVDGSRDMDGKMVVEENGILTMVRSCSAVRPSNKSSGWFGSWACRSGKMIWRIVMKLL
jgi:hypothetical protein